MRLLVSGRFLFALAMSGLALSFMACDAAAQGFQNPIEDAWLREDAPNNNYGSDNELRARTRPGEDFRALYRFDLSAIPAGANVTQADVWIWVTGEDDSGEPVNIYRVTDNWSEGTVNWSNTGNDYDATVHASFVPAAAGWVQVDLKDLVQSWACEASDNYGFMLIPTSSDKESKYSSREWNPGNRRPRLYLKTSGTNPCPLPPPPEFIMNHDNFGINCLDETIGIEVVDSITGTLRTDYIAEITLDTQTGDGTWALVSGSGTLIDATANDGLATYDWPSGESTAEFSLSYSSGTATFDIDAYQSSDPAIRDDDSEGTIVFTPSGFTLTAGALSNPPPAVIPPFSATQIAGTDFPIHIAAFGQTPGDPVCGIIESYTGTQNLKFWSSFLDPVSGTRNVTIDAVAMATTEVTAAATYVAFSNGQATVVGKYKDVGRIQISVKDDTLPHPDLPNGIGGATAGFVVKPDHFALSNVEDGSGSPNPAAVDSTGPVFVAAGEAFSVSITVFDAEGDITPNYGQEDLAESVRLTPSLVAPVAGNNPPLGAATDFGPFAGGQATGSNFNWSEVGIITLTPSVGDGSYLGAGDVVGLASGNVGRFSAHHFTTVLNTPTFATRCSAGSFTYIGETFDYSNNPVVTVTARALAGEVTENYAGNFFKIDNTSLPDPVYTSTPATLDTSGVPSGSSDPLVASTGAGVGTLTFTVGSGLAYVRGAQQSPFDADIRLSIDVLDTDGVAALANPVVFGSTGGIVFDSGANMRYGRARVQNAYGSELVDLALPFATEYFVDTATGFVPNTDDSCTTAVALSLGAFTDNLAAGETCVVDSGAPGDSGAGCAAAGIPGLRFREPPLGGDFNLYLLAPGAGNDGSTTATADVPDWLEFDWDTALPGLEDPLGTAVFGIFSGTDQHIYIREVY